MTQWKGQAKEKVGMYKSALKQAIEDREHVEQILKEKIMEQRTKYQQLESEKLFLKTEFDN